MRSLGNSFLPHSPNTSGKPDNAPVLRQKSVRFAQRNRTFGRTFRLSRVDLRNAWYSDEDVRRHRQAAAVLISLHHQGHQGLYLRGLEPHLDQTLRAQKRREMDMFRYQVLVSQKSDQAAKVSKRLSAKDVLHAGRMAQLDECEAAIVYEDQTLTTQTRKRSSTGVILTYSFFSHRKETKRCEYKTIEGR